MNTYKSWPELVEHCFLAILAVAIATAIMVWVGQNTLGVAVIALLYLLPISYSTTQWGQAAGVSAALVSALGFDFFFIPPYHTFTIGSLEGWLVLVIFLAVAILIIGRIQYGLAQAREREREALFMYEAISAIGGLHSQESIALYLADKIQQVYQADLVQISFDADGRSRIVSLPEEVYMSRKPDLILPVQTINGLDGEVCIWKGRIPLPQSNNRFLQSLANQGGLALERARLSNRHANA